MENHNSSAIAREKKEKAFHSQRESLGAAAKSATEIVLNGYLALNKIVGCLIDSVLRALMQTFNLKRAMYRVYELFLPHIDPVMVPIYSLLHLICTNNKLIM